MVIVKTNNISPQKQYNLLSAVYVACWKHSVNICHLLYDDEICEFVNTKHEQITIRFYLGVHDGSTFKQKEKFLVGLSFETQMHCRFVITVKMWICKSGIRSIFENRITCSVFPSSLYSYDSVMNRSDFCDYLHIWLCHAGNIYISFIPSQN